MSVAGSIDAPIEIIGGLVCDEAPAVLPLGVSPDCQDMAWSQSAAATRPGLTSVYAAIAGNPTINYIKTYESLEEVLATLVWDSAGELWAENSVGVLTSVAAALAWQSPYADSTTMFGREYMAFSDGKTGQDIPRQYDGMNVDRVSQVGPGAGPTGITDIVANISAAARATDVVTITTATPTGLIYGSGITIASIYRVGNVVTVTTEAAFGIGGHATGGVVIAGVTDSGFDGSFAITAVLSPTQFTYAQSAANATSSGGTATYADQVVIAGVTDSSFDGTFILASVVDSLNFTYAQTHADGTSSGGSAAPVGSISAGLHQCCVIFVTRQGYLTRPSPPVSWVSGGGVRANVTGIPSVATLPNVVARILCFTIAGGAQFFYTTGNLGAPQMQIFDNTASSYVVDFNDADLTGGTDATELFSLIELGECAGVIGYSQRVVWWGERNKQNNWENLTFDGGFVDATGTTAPLGWTPDATYFAGGGNDTSGEAIWGGAYAIKGDGSTATRGLITQSAVSDYLGTARIGQETAYSVRARVRMTGALTQGTLHIHLYSSSLSISTAGIQVTPSQITAGAWKEFIAPLTTAITLIPPDLLLRVYADGTPTNAAGFLIDNIEIFPTAQPVNGSLARVSLAEDPESFDGVKEFMNVAENNGQAIRAAFELRGNLYFVKERSMHSTSDNGQESSTWDITQVSGTVGTPSARGVDVGEDWAIIAHRSGLFIFNGAEPQKISQEVSHSASGLTLAWDQINWAHGEKLWVVVDKVQRRILVGAPFGVATSPNYILHLDYRDVDGGAEAIAGAPPIVVSYRGRKIVKDKSRKWSPWTISANCGAAVERFDGTQQIFLGSGSYGNQLGTGKIYQVDETNLTDDGKAIPSYYVMAFTPDRDTEQTLQMHAHRKLFYYLAMYCEGKGYLNVTAFPLNENNGQLCAQLRLTSPAVKDLEATINVVGERVAFKLASDATVPGNWLRLQKFIPSMNGDPWSPVRGQN